jgi:hypothetical protein
VLGGACRGKEGPIWWCEKEIITWKLLAGFAGFAMDVALICVLLDAFRQVTVTRGKEFGAYEGERNVERMLYILAKHNPSRRLAKAKQQPKHIAYPERHASHNIPNSKCRVT